MKFFKFMEAKFTEHSLNQQVTEFSILADGEQKATQAIMNLARSSAKWWAMIKLPIHFLACSLGLTVWPATSETAVQAFTERKRLEAEKAKLAQLENADKAKVLNIAPNLESKPVEMQ